MCEDVAVTAHGYARIHLHPKRFPAAYSVDWRTRIIHETDQYVAVNKPAGIQVPPTVDNVTESLMACVAKVRDVLRRCAVQVACFFWEEESSLHYFESS